MTNDTTQPTTTKPKLRHRRGFLPAAVGLVALLVGVAMGNNNSGSSNTTDQAVAESTVTVSATGAGATVTATPTKVVATKTVQVRVTLTPAPISVTSNGQYVVGSEIKPGTWHTDDTDCYYARLHDLDGVDSIITNDNTGPATIQIHESDKAVQFNGGCAWRKIG